MSNDSDYLYALELQKRLDAGDDDFEELNKSTQKPLQVKRSNPHSNLDEEFLNRTHNLVHPQWETLDPTPDVFALFNQFDDKFFQSRLKCVTLEWSKRMYSCAGICYSRRNRLGMDITIRLSEPLLTLRSRKDLVETMLHEMIHAYCFVLHIREGNGGHGPNFKKIMYAINKVAGTNITVYHTFHDEVKVYKQHWWRCNGVCQDRSPFFGYVKRASNRAPGPNDFWWAKHLQECGGTFMKIKEPEKKRTTKSTKLNNKENRQGNNDLHKFFTTQSKTNATQTLTDLNKKPNGGALKSNGSGTLLVNSKTTSSVENTPSSSSSSIAQLFPPSSYPGLSSNPLQIPKTSSTANRSKSLLGALDAQLSNVVGFKNLENNTTGLRKTISSTNWGKGNSLSSSCSSNTSLSANLNTNDEVDRQRLREARLKRFNNNTTSPTNTEKRKSDEDDSTETENAKRQRAMSPPQTITSSDDVCVLDDSIASTANTKKNWIKVDDDVMLQEPEEEIINLSSGEESNCDDDFEYKTPKSLINKNMTMNERQTVIKREILDESIDLCDNDIELIDDEYDDKINDNDDARAVTAAVELADSSIIDEFFGEDTLLKEYRLENDVDARNFKYLNNPNSDIITCPICQSKMSRGVFAEHLDGCTGIAVKIKPPKHALKKLSAISKEARPKRQTRPSKKNAKEILREAGYTEDDLAQLSSMDDDDDVSVLDASTSSPGSSAHSVLHLNSSPDDENTRRYRLRNIYKSTRQCPRCGTEIEETEIYEHMRECRCK